MKIRADQLEIGDIFDAGPSSVHRKRKKVITAVVRGRKGVSLAFDDGSRTNFKPGQKVTVER